MDFTGAIDLSLPIGKRILADIYIQITYFALLFYVRGGLVVTFLKT
jgi:hypothetical protein